MTRAAAKTMLIMDIPITAGINIFNVFFITTFSFFICRIVFH